MKSIFYSVFLITVLGCDSKSTNKFQELTSNFYALEESNYNDFRALIEKAHAPTSDFSAEVLNIYDMIDTVVTDILHKSGGYSEMGYMIRGENVEIGKIAITGFDLLQKVKNRIELMKSDNFEKDVFDNALIEELEIALHPILADKLNLNSTVAKIYLDLLIMQNRILVAEVRYYELKYVFNEPDKS